MLSVFHFAKKEIKEQVYTTIKWFNTYFLIRGEGFKATFGSEQHKQPFIKLC